MISDVTRNFYQVRGNILNRLTRNCLEYLSPVSNRNMCQHTSAWEEGGSL